MRRFILASIAAAATAPVPRAARAQVGGRVPVEVIADTDTGNAVGEQLTYQIRERFRRSAGFVLTDPTTRGIHVRLMISSVRMPAAQAAAIYNVTWLLRRGDTVLYLGNVLGYCGTAVLEDVLEGIVARTDGYISESTRRQLSSQ